MPATAAAAYQAGMVTLDKAQVGQALAELDGWDLQQGKLHRLFRFRDFSEAFGFMASVATIAEAQNHHPEWKNVWREVEVWLSSHDAGGLTERDLRLAREIQARAARLAD